MGIDLELATMPMGVAFGKYELLERIATGGMAEIYRAVSSSVGGFRKQVALKRILPHLSSDEEFVSLFVSEAKLAVELSHSNVVQILDFGRVEDTYYLAMELVDGRDLTEVLMKQARLGATLPLEAVCYLLAEVCRGLEYAHTRCGPDGRPLGIVHRDVSPHNVLVSYDGEIKLTDFGVAKARSRVAEERPGALLGKYAYMSPEQARGDDVDARSDVYSAGVTLFESLTGRRLFYHEDPQLTLQRVRRPSVVPPSSYRPEIPAALDRIVMSALAPRADDRTPSARALATELQSFLRELAPGYNDSHLSRTMKDLFEDEVGAARFAMAAPTAPERTGAVVVPGGLAPSELGDPVLEALAERLEHDPSLWTLVELADRLQRLERPLEAERALILGAAKFAQNGLLVQALALAVRLRDQKGWTASVEALVHLLPGLAGVTNFEVAARLGPLGDDALGSTLRTVLEAAEPSSVAAALGSPAVSLLGSDELPKLARLLRLERRSAGSTIVREGEPGDTLYVIARGRVIVYCTSPKGRKVYLSSLSDGDCVGEFSFFTGEKRAATVEALDEVLLFEIDRAELDRVVKELRTFTRSLLTFYKERVVAILLARSELFSVLPPKVRQGLAGRLVSEGYQRGDAIVREGEAAESFYLIKSGEVEVVAGGDGAVFLSKLKPGDFFGEIACIQETPRTATVRALGPVEVLRLARSDLAELASAHPELLSALRTRIAQRSAATRRALTAGWVVV